MTANNRYYPNLTELLNVDFLPDQFKTAIQNLLSDLFYSDLQIGNKINGGTKGIKFELYDNVVVIFNSAIFNFNRCNPNLFWY